MPRKRTGSIEPYTDAGGVTRYWARIRLGDGSRHREKVPEGYSEKRALAFAHYIQEAEDRDHAIIARKVREARTKVASSEGETCDAWFERRVEIEGLSLKDKYAWKNWVSPVIGTKGIATITPDAVEDVRDKLDAAFAEWKKLGRGPGRLAAKSARNVWTLVTGSFREACASRRRELRVRTDNPASGILPPEKGEKKAKTFFYPREYEKLVAAESIPIEWRILHTLAGYTYLRPGELRVLRWDDVDFDGGILNITKAWDYEKAVVKEVKTGDVRMVPIEENLRPLLVALRKHAKGKDLVIPMLGAAVEDDLAETTRRHFRMAGVARPALFKSSNTELSARFRTWRDSGITWRAIRGDDPLKIMRAAGHRGFATTQGYIHTAENFAGLLGSPFPPIPSDLIDWANVQAKTSAEFHGTSEKTLYYVCEGGDLNASYRYGRNKKAGKKALRGDEKFVSARAKSSSTGSLAQTLAQSKPDRNGVQ